MFFYMMRLTTCSEFESIRIRSILWYDHPVWYKVTLLDVLLRKYLIKRLANVSCYNYILFNDLQVNSFTLIDLNVNVFSLYFYYTILLRFNIIYVCYITIITHSYYYIIYIYIIRMIAVSDFSIAYRYKFTYIYCI